MRWIDRTLVRPNEYNPNSHTDESLDLLSKSIQASGWTQPIVVRPPDEDGMHRIVDGAHRFKASGLHGMGDKVPVVVLEADGSECIAATVRHNRARGSHGVEEMSGIVRTLAEQGASEEAIGEAMGMKPDEVKRLMASEELFLHMQAGRDQVMQQ